MTALRRRIHIAEVDLNYALYYPLMRPYSSLYPSAKREAGNEQPERETKGDADMWKAVEQAMDAGTLDALRESKPNKPALQPKEDAPSKREKGRRHKHRNMLDGTQAAAAGQQDEESDGGFFE